MNIYKGTKTEENLKKAFAGNRKPEINILFSPLKLRKMGMSR